MTQVSSPNLNVCLTNWSHVSKWPKFTASAFHICDFTADPLNKVITPYEELEAIIFIGSFQGEIIRWIVHKDGASPVSTSNGHNFNSKIVQFEECTFPFIRNAIVSLSYDGSICVWSVLDGICLRHFPQILPKGCQRIACSNSAIEIAAVSGSFPNIYIIDIQRGYIIQEIRPIPKFAVSLKFYSKGDSEWLFALGSNGCASFTTLTPKTTSSHRFGIFSSEENDVLINAYPSPLFYFVICVYSKGFSVVAMFSKDFPHYATHDYPNIQSAIWLKEDTFVLIKYDGSFTKYTLKLPIDKIQIEKVPENQEIYEEIPSDKIPAPDSIIKNIKYTTDLSIKSVLQEKSSAEILDHKMRITTLINPFQTPPFTREKIEQISSDTIKQYNIIMDENIKNAEDNFQMLEQPSKENEKDKGKDKDKNKDSKKSDSKGKDKDSKKSDSKSKGKSKKGDSKKQQETENETTESQSPTIEDEDHINDTNSNEQLEDFKYEVNPEFQLQGESNIPLPLISKFNQDIAFAFDDYIILAKKNYQEFALSIENSMIEKEEEDKNAQSNDKKEEDKCFEVTAQSYYIKDNKIIALIEGNAYGMVTYQSSSGRREGLGKFHTGRVVAMCTAGDLLFTSGKDCKLNVYSLQLRKTVNCYSNFVSPVTKFYFPVKKTHTSIDNCVFCSTSDGIISVIDRSNYTSPLFILTSHESQIEKIYFHPPTKLLLVKCRSLYFWSMITGNLESIMNGQQMFKYLDDMKDNLYEVTDEKLQIATPTPYITRFGNFNLRATEIDICDFALQIGSILDSRKKDSLKTAMKSIHNLSFLNNLLSTKTSKILKKELDKKLHKRMNICFSGADSVLTLNLDKLEKKREWQYSPQVTALLLSVRIALSYALKHHPYFSKPDIWRDIIKADTISIFKKELDISYLIKITLDLDANAHKYIFHMITKMHKYEERQSWLKKIIIIKKNKLFKNYQKFFDLLYIIIKATLFTDLQNSNDSSASDFATYLYNYQSNQRNYKTFMARELISFHEENAKPIMKYYSEDQKKELFLNLFKYSKFILASSAIDYFINDDYTNYLSVCSNFVRNNTRNNPKDCIRIIGNLAHVLKSNENKMKNNTKSKSKNQNQSEIEGYRFKNYCSTILCNCVSYFTSSYPKNYYDIKTLNDYLTKTTAILHDLSKNCHHFGCNSGMESTYMAFGTNDGILYVYKLKRSLYEFSTQSDYESLFEDDNDICDEETKNRITIMSGSGQGAKPIPNSKSFSSTSQSSQNQSSPTSSPPFPRSKSLSSSATANLNASNKSENFSKATSGKSDNMVSDSEPSMSATNATNGGSQSNAASAASSSAATTVSTDSIVFGSIQLNTKRPIHSVTVWANGPVVFAASDDKIYRISIASESTSSSANQSSDESSLKPKLKLSSIEKKVNEKGTFQWEKGLLRYIFPDLSNYEISLTSNQL